MVATTDPGWTRDLQLEELAILTGGEVAEITSAELLYDDPQGLQPASPDDLLLGPGMDLLPAPRLIQRADPAPKDTSEAARDHSPASVIGRGLPGESRSTGSSAELRFSTLTPAFGFRPERAGTWRGGAESATGRAKLEWGKWSAGALFDKDAFEPRWDDLSRFFVSRKDDRLDVIAGDLTAAVGEGVTLWNRPQYFSPYGAASKPGRRAPALAPARHTQVNSAFRGLGSLYDDGNRHLLLIAADTHYDAIQNDSGEVLRLSDGGLHRSVDEDRKRGTLRERLIGGGAGVCREVAGIGWSLGVAGWRGWFDPPLTPETAPADRFPLTGADAGVVGATVGADWSGGEGAIEVATDRNGASAQAVRCMVADPSVGVAAKMILYHYPEQFQNPHSADIAGRRPQGIQGAALLAQKKLNGTMVKRLTFTGGIAERLQRTGKAVVTLFESRASAEADGAIGRWDLGLKASRKESSNRTSDLAGEATDRLRLRADRPIANDMLLSSWCEAARADNSPDLVSDGDAQDEVSGGDARHHRTDAGWAAGATLRCRFPLASIFNSESPSHLETSFTLLYQSTPASLPIYAGEVDYPDRVAAIRLAGNGVRVSLAGGWQVGDGRWIRFRASRGLTLGGGAKRDGKLYLSLSFQT